MCLLHLLECVFRLLLPPACHEHVLGDLRETYKSPWHYFAAAVGVLGAVIVSRVRRTTDFQVFLMEAFAVYLSFSAAAWWLGQKTFLYDQTGFARLAIPTTVSVVSLLLCNAYADQQKQSHLAQPILHSAGSISLAFLGQAILFDTLPGLSVPFAIMLYGSFTSIVLVSTVRMLFRQILSGQANSALSDKPHSPQRTGSAPVRVPLRQNLSEDLSQGKTKYAIVLVGLLTVLFASIQPSMFPAFLAPQHLLLVCLVVVIVLCGAKN